MTPPQKPWIAVIGAGPAGLMAAEHIAQAGIRVTIFDQMPNMGRKFLMAGRSGLNLTHSEPLEALLARYSKGRELIEPAIRAFPPQNVQHWAQELGQPTFIGSSGRIFPTTLKASPLLRRWIARLQAMNVRFLPRHTLTKLESSGQLTFTTPNGAAQYHPNAVVLAMGGGSWPKLGSNGSFVPLLHALNINSTPLQAANCAIHVPWSAFFLNKFEGIPIKRCRLSFENHSTMSDVMVTQDGLEGSAAYALASPLQAAIAAQKTLDLRLDLRPETPLDTLIHLLTTARGKQSLSNFLRKALGLSPISIALLQEQALRHNTPLNQLSSTQMAQLIKQYPIEITGIASLERAISSSGGVSLSEVSPDFSLKNHPNLFVAGEMIDWDAPTGGYLLQACFATGRQAGLSAVQWLQTQTSIHS